MRITQTEISRNFLSDLGLLNGDLANANRQVSSGKRINSLEDSPSGSAELVRMAKMESEVDQYRFNSNAGSLYLNVADSTLAEVNNLITSVFSKGSQAASENVNEEGRATSAADIRSLREQIVSLANSQVNGRYLFAGSMINDNPFSIAGESVVYSGDNTVSRIKIDDRMDVPASFDGDEVFNLIFSNIESLLAGIDSSDIAEMRTALDQFSTSLSGLSRVRGQIGSHMNALDSAKSILDSRETTLKEQRSKIEDVDMAKAVVQLNQTQTALQAAMSAGASALQQSNLFDILG
jgi:flagellar hook-associated protein 3 FlgL